MSQLRTIFKKIEEDFFRFHLDGESESNFELIFSPLSTGYSYEDFLFLNSNMASEEAHKYYDELLEFSQIANTIPRRKIWTVSGESGDYLFNVYRNLLWGLRLLDPDSLTAEMLYNHPIFEQAIQVLRDEERQTYYSFFSLHQKLASEIASLKETSSGENRAVVDLEIQLKEENLEKIKEQWLEQGLKEKVESKILDVVKDEFKRFLLRLNDIKAQLETLRRDHVGRGESFCLTSCIPNNLYKGEGLEWKTVKIEKQEISSLLQKLKKEEFEAVFGESDLEGLEIEGISYDLLFVDVTRGWYDPDVLTSPFWDINLLNPESISIPRYTSKLIFIKNVDVRLPERSESNNRILQTAKIAHLGPFIINAQQLQRNRNLKLNSVNGGLKIDRKTVLNVSSGLNVHKNTPEISLNTMVAKKQNQFVRLAPQLRNTNLQAKKVGRPAGQIRDHRTEPTVRPVFQTMILRTNFIAFQPVTVNIHFLDADSGSPVHVKQGDIKFKSQNKEVAISSSVAASGAVTAKMNKDHTYNVEVDTEGYLLFNATFKATPTGNLKHMDLSYRLHKEVLQDNSDSDTFQLIGVVTRKMSKYPNPILQADYL